MVEWDRWDWKIEIGECKGDLSFVFVNRVKWEFIQTDAEKRKKKIDWNLEPTWKKDCENYGMSILGASFTEYCIGGLKLVSYGTENFFERLRR